MLCSKPGSIFNIPSLAIIADDSGLVVPALGGEPGIYSARYAGEKANYRENNRKLLQRMSGLEGDQRRAHFICQMVYLDRQICLSALGLTRRFDYRRAAGPRWFWLRSLVLRGGTGKTYAQLRPEQKNAISHRYRALRNLRLKIIALLGK